MGDYVLKTNDCLLLQEDEESAVAAAAARELASGELQRCHYSTLQYSTAQRTLCLELLHLSLSALS